MRATTTADTASPSSPSGLRWRPLLALLCVALAATRIVSTYTVFSETYDEGVHIAAGMELLDRGSFTYEPKHPPLARVAVALGPWLSGIGSQGEASIWSEGRAIIHAKGSTRTLFLARLGVLPFFALACLVLWSWTRQLTGEPEALIAVALFTLTPIVLAHSGVATTDMALTATLLALAWAFARWLEDPSTRRGVWVGIAGAAALTAKLSSVAFFGFTLLLVLATRWWLGRREGVAPLTGRHLRSLGVVLSVCFLFVWSLYRFQTGSWHGIPVPLTVLAQGIRDLAAHNAFGHAAYLLGKADFDGDWRFFLVGLGVKAPLTLLGFGLAGAWLLARRAVQTRDWRLWVPLLLAAAVLAVSVPARINIGVRHVLPLFGLLTMWSGIALAAAWRRTPRLGGRVAIGAVAVAGLLSTARVHPDYLAYFNELAGAEPDRILVDSDLDWGQDLRRLADTLAARRIDAVTIAYFGSAVPAVYGVPVRAAWTPGQPVTGWFVVSRTLRRRGPASLRNGQWIMQEDALRWLDAYQPVTAIGPSLQLFNIPATATPTQRLP